MTLTLSTLGRNAACGAITGLINTGDTNPNGWIEIRTGIKPTTPQITAPGTLLSVLPFSNPAFADPINGVAAANAIGADTNVDSTGVASWFRVYNRNGVAIYDGDISVTGGGGDITFDNINFIIGGTVALTTLNITMPQ